MGRGFPGVHRRVVWPGGCLFQHTERWGLNGSVVFSLLIDRFRLFIVFPGMEAHIFKTEVMPDSF